MTDEFPEQSETTDISLEDLLIALLNETTPLAPRYLFRLSDLSPEDQSLIANSWLDISPDRRQRLIEDLEILEETSSIVSFETVFINAMTDPVNDIRRIAIRSLWESEDHNIIPTLLEILETDPDPQVQAQAASSLGHFIYLGELGNLKSEHAGMIVDKLISLLNSEGSQIIQQRALESLGYCGDSRIGLLIEDASDREDTDWIACALVAMGRSANEIWQPYTMDKLDHSDSKVRLEAIRAAGELVILDAIPALMNTLQDEDAEHRLTAAWSLSEIGGNEARDGIQYLIDQTEDEGELELLETAMDNLAFNEELGAVSLMGLPEDYPDDPPESSSDEV